ncbi:caspase family protein [Actinosynnema sp. NPDC020468]|uniref:caspase family protein n=1 Tax=Actinosynnema sp. NPDC020468 TaxID=3154488 RepID=UPI0033EDB583
MDGLRAFGSGGRHALIIANDDYRGAGLRKLRAPARDARHLAAVLADPAIGGFTVSTVLNESASATNQAIQRFFDNRGHDDLLVLYVSGHGVKDTHGDLYFATADTDLEVLESTAVSGRFVSDRLARTWASRVVLLLDCCYAGAFRRGAAHRAGDSVAVQEQFEGVGKVVLTASSDLEYAFEGLEVVDDQERGTSVFTSALVEGLLTGDADRDQDGYVNLNELYDYVYSHVRRTTPDQTPGISVLDQEGRSLRFARRARPVTVPSPLPAELTVLVASGLATARVAAVAELRSLLRGGHQGLALAASLELTTLRDDDSRQVSAAARAALGDPEPPTTEPPPVAPTTSDTAPDPGPTDTPTTADPEASVTRTADRTGDFAEPSPSSVDTFGGVRGALVRSLALVTFLVAATAGRAGVVELRGGSWHPGAVDTVALWLFVGALVALVGLPARSPGRVLVPGIGIAGALVVLVDLVYLPFVSGSPGPLYGGLQLTSTGMLLACAAALGVLACALEAADRRLLAAAPAVPFVLMTALALGKPALFDSDSDPSATWPILAVVILVVQAGLVALDWWQRGTPRSRWLGSTLFLASVTAITVLVLITGNVRDHDWTLITLSAAFALHPLRTSPDHRGELVATMAIGALLLYRAVPTEQSPASYLYTALTLLVLVLGLTRAVSRPQ